MFWSKSTERKSVIDQSSCTTPCHDQLRGTVLNVHAGTNNAGWAIVKPAHCQRTFFIFPIIMIIFVKGSSLSCSRKTL